jgi:hypothetical protein
LPVTRAEDPPKDKDGKKEAVKKDQTPKQRYDALVKEHQAKQAELRQAYQKANQEEQQKIVKEFEGLGGKFADRFAQLAEEDPKGVGTPALFWILQNANGTPAHAKAADKVKAVVADTPVKELIGTLRGLRFAPPAVLDAALARAEKDEKDPQAGDLVAWVITAGRFSPAGRKAVDRLLEKYPDHPAVEQAVATLGRAGGPGAEGRLKELAEKSAQPKVKAAAALALARALADKVDGLGDKPADADKFAAEAETYFTKAIDLSKDNAAQKKAAETELKALQTLRVGKEAPDIQAPDLDGKAFKLSDYRGKVVLLDFWGHW